MGAPYKMAYFDEYVHLINLGKVKVSKYVHMQIERVKRFKKEYIYQSKESINRIAFIENECSNTKGVNSKLKLALCQKAWLDVSWGFYVNKTITKTNPETLEKYEEKILTRLTNETVFILGRGSGKTTLCAAVGKVGQIYDSTFGNEYGADVQMLAYTREQANLLFDASRAMNNFEGTILYDLKHIDKTLRSTKQGELYVPTNSYMQIKTSDYEVLDGTNSHYNIFDELHTYDDDFIDVVNTGSKRKRQNWMSWYISTNGTKRNALFDRYFNNWLKVLEGKLKDDSIQIWLYVLDSFEEIYDETCWEKSMPLLGITSMPEDIRKDIELSKDDPIKQAELLAKTFNIPMNSFHAYFTNEECKGNSEKFIKDLFIGSTRKNAYVILSFDLSDVNDICSITFMTKYKNEFYFMNRKYLPKIAMNKVKKSVARQYEDWEREGHLILHDGDYNDKNIIWDDLLKFMSENHILPIKVGFDKWGFDEMKRNIESVYGGICEEVPQNAKTLSQPMKIYKSLLKSGRIIFDDPVSTWCHANVKVKEDSNKNIFPNKKNSDEKIDVFMSNLFAFITYNNFKEQLDYYYDFE